MFTAGRFGDVAGAAILEWSEEDMIVWVLVRMFGLWSKVVICVGGAEVGENVRQCNHDRGWQ